MGNTVEIAGGDIYVKFTCYETIMFGRVTHMLDTAAMQRRSVGLHHFF